MSAGQPQGSDQRDGDPSRSRFSLGKMLAGLAAAVSIAVGVQQLTRPEAPKDEPATPISTATSPDRTDEPDTTPPTAPTTPIATEASWTENVEEVCLSLEDEALRGPQGLVGYDSPQAFANAAERLRNLRKPASVADRLHGAAEDFDDAAKLAAGSFFPRAAEEEQKAREVLVELGAGGCSAMVLQGG